MVAAVLERHRDVLVGRDFPVLQRSISRAFRDNAVSPAKGLALAQVRF